MIYKRCFDLVGSLLVLFLATPLIIMVSILVWRYLGRPIMFIQQRPGKHGKPFNLVKFRTMKSALDKNGNPLPDAERLTKFGKWLRSTSLDELPELWNVLVGHMSLVGPRPLLEEYLPLYSPAQARRHESRPGITGWAQVNGRNELSWEKKFEMDVWYVENQSLMLDLKILLKTVYSVLARDGISATDSVTMTRFEGSE